MDSGNGVVARQRRRPWGADPCPWGTDPCPTGTDACPRGGLPCPVLSEDRGCSPVASLRYLYHKTYPAIRAVRAPPSPKSLPCCWCHTTAQRRSCAVPQLIPLCPRAHTTRCVWPGPQAPAAAQRYHTGPGALRRKAALVLESCVSIHYLQSCAATAQSMPVDKCRVVVSQILEQ